MNKISNIFKYRNDITNFKKPTAKFYLEFAGEKIKSISHQKISGRIMKVKVQKQNLIKHSRNKRQVLNRITFYNKTAIQIRKTFKKIFKNIKKIVLL